MCFVALFGRPELTLYFIIPLLPYRSLRDHYLDYPLGTNILTILVACLLIGGFIHGKGLPSKSKILGVWLVLGVYLYFSMWIGAALGNGPAPLWLSDINFSTWKDYMLMPLILLAASMVIGTRKEIRTVILVSAVALLFIDRSALMNSLSHTWGHFDENKRDGGPLGWAGSNGLAAFLAQFTMFFWGFVLFVKRKKAKLLLYGLVAMTLFATMYTFSRASYISLIAAVFLLGILKDRKLIPIVILFLFTWQFIVPTAVTERVTMTKSANGQLEESGQERITLWENAKKTILSNPIVGIGYATYQLTAHTDNLHDTHNWYVKVMLETGIIGMIIVLILLQQMLALSYKLFRTATDPLYQGLGLGLVLTIFSSAVLNFFGDRWTYLEINGMLWVLIAAAMRALQLTQSSPGEGGEEPVSPKESIEVVNPYMALR